MPPAKIIHFYLHIVVLNIKISQIKSIMKNIIPILSAGLVAAVLVGCTDMSSTNNKSTVTKADFGKTPGGTPVAIYTLVNSKGAEARIMTYGGIVQKLTMPDKAGKFALHAGGIGRGVGAGFHVSGKTVAQRTDDGTRFAQQSECLGNPLAHRSLAISPGDAHHPEFFARVVIDETGNFCRKLLQMKNAHVGHGDLHVFRALLLPEHGSSASGHRFLD